MTNIRLLGQKRKDDIYRNRYDKMTEIIDQWVTRMGKGRYFHGEDGPDLADFKMFAACERRVGYNWVRDSINKSP